MHSESNIEAEKENLKIRKRETKIEIPVFQKFYAKNSRNFQSMQTNKERNKNSHFGLQ